MISYGQVKGRKYPACQPLPLSESVPNRRRSNAVVLDGERVFSSAGAAAAYAGVTKHEALRVLRGDRKSTRGHTFYYLEDIEVCHG